MCVSCGCHEYAEDHGNEQHIVLDEVEQAGGPENLSQERIQAAADAANISLEEAKRNIQNDYAAAGTS